jgi:hypothetical protein
MKASLGNPGSCSPPRPLAVTMKNRPALLDGLLAQAGLAIEPEAPCTRRAFRVFARSAVFSPALAQLPFQECNTTKRA